MTHIPRAAVVRLSAKVFTIFPRAATLLIAIGAFTLLGSFVNAADTAKSVVKAVDNLKDVVIPEGPIIGKVHGVAWEVKRAKLSGDKLLLYPDSNRPTPMLEISNLTELLHGSLGKGLLEKAIRGDKTAKAKLGEIPPRPPLESARIAIDKEDGLFAMMTKAKLTRASGDIYHCDLGLPLIVEFGKKANGTIPIALYFRHEFNADKILLAGHVTAKVE